MDWPTSRGAAHHPTSAAATATASPTAGRRDDAIRAGDANANRAGGRALRDPRCAAIGPARAQPPTVTADAASRRPVLHRRGQRRVPAPGPRRSARSPARRHRKRRSATRPAPPDARTQLARGCGAACRAAGVAARRRSATSLRSVKHPPPAPWQMSPTRGPVERKAPAADRRAAAARSKGQA